MGSLAEQDAPPKEPQRYKIHPAKIAYAKELWLSGRSSPWCQKLLSKRYKCSERWAREMLRQAREQLRAEVSPVDPDEARAEAKRKLDAAFEVARKKKDARGMVAAAKAQAELDGVLGTHRVEVSGSVGVSAAVAFYVPEEKE